MKIKVVLLGVLFIVVIATLMAFFISKSSPNVQNVDTKIQNLNVTVVPGIYLYNDRVYLVYFRPFQEVTIYGKSYSPANQTIPNGVFILENNTVIKFGSNVVVSVVIDNVVQNVTLPVFYGPVGIPPGGYLKLTSY
ncbi:MAG: hypothetical protein QXR57_04225 [Metallosphaera sp.]|uniref:hypothetical protein n=1 Tax=Metallosphaera sp. TaxID=2020860 RepID=UPI00316240B0